MAYTSIQDIMNWFGETEEVTDRKISDIVITENLNGNSTIRSNSTPYWVDMEKKIEELATIKFNEWKQTRQMPRKHLPNGYIQSEEDLTPEMKEGLYKIVAVLNDITLEKKLLEDFL